MIYDAYTILLKNFGKQGWWPLLDYRGENPTKTGSVKGYHPGVYDIPDNQKQIFEVCIGALLAQNTSWQNAEKALINLKKNKILNPKSLSQSSQHDISIAIKSAGYHNQKAKKIRIFSEFFISLNGRAPERNELLSLWGIGKETADSMLLYAYKKPNFVIDAYTKRISSRAGFSENESEYDKFQELFQSNLPADYRIYNEFHALLVELAKRNCKSIPSCNGCALSVLCKLGKSRN